MQGSSHMQGLLTCFGLLPPSDACLGGEPVYLIERQHEEGAGTPVGADGVHCTVNAGLRILRMRRRNASGSLESVR
jgi:hypothetical protein